MLDVLYTITYIGLCLALGYLVNYYAGGLPASLYGMILLTIMLRLRLCKEEKVKASIAWGVRHMGVCFVPAGVGITNHGELIKSHGVALVAITFITTFIVLTFVGVLFQQIENKHTDS